MAITIISDYIDAAGYRRVLLQSDADPSQSLQLKFPPGMSVAEMKSIAQQTIDAVKAEVQAANDEQNRKAQISAGVAQYQSGLLTNVQKVALLDALVDEWDS